jgi:hypothetical protein
MQFHDHPCFMLPPQQPPCFILLGKFGDLLQLLPAFKAVHDRSGLKPIVMVSQIYSSVLEGASYVEPWVIEGNWWTGVPAAKQLAKEHFGGGLVVQWWADSPWLWNKEAGTTLMSQGHITIQSHGIGHGVDMALAPNYATSMWLRSGLSIEEMKSMPPVLDLRSPEREQRLIDGFRFSKKPLLLVDLNSHGYQRSSPFAMTPEIMQVVNQFARHFTIVDLGRIRSHRIYDLIGLMEASAGMITSDTASLHMAPATNIPYVAYTVDGWCSSVPKGNCKLEIKYSQAIARRNELVPLLESWAASAKPRVGGGQGGGGVIMRT